MQEKTYTELLSLIKGLCGVDNFTTSEQTSLLGFVNRRALEAYEASQGWTRYLVVEERTISSSPAQTIPYTESGKNNIAEFLRIHRTQPFLRLSAVEFQFWTDSNGAHILNLSTTDATSAWVTYKKELSAITASSTDIPLEFYNYIAHSVYADFLRMDSLTDKALAEEQVAYMYLMQQMERTPHINNNNIIATKFTTHINTQSRF